MKPPDNIDDTAWIMLCAYLCVAFGPEWEKMTRGLCSMLEKEGYEIRKIKK